MAPHHIDLCRYFTGLDIVQVKADTFIPRYSNWQGSSTVFLNMALAHPDDYNHRHNWIWVQYYGDWQARGPQHASRNHLDLYYGKGHVNAGKGWIEIDRYLDEEGRKSEEDAFLAVDAGDDGVEHMGTPWDGQMIILEQMKRSIESNGKNKPLNKFEDIFKSFTVSMGAIESSRTGKAVWVPDYWKDLPI